MLYKFFQAQVDFPVKNDWINSVNEDLSQLNMSMEDVKNKSEYQFKKELKLKIKSASFQYLQNIIIDKKHSKMENLKYESLNMQSYLYSRIINKTEGRNLFMFRTRMALFANNFKNGSDVTKCPKCKDLNSIDSEAHSLNCEKIIDNLKKMVNQFLRHFFI